MKNDYQKITNQKGFTLIEIMIVVAILGILVAIVIPQYQRFTAKSKRTEGLMLLKGLHTAELSYFASNDEYAFSDPAAGFKGLPPNLGYSPASAAKFYDTSSDGVKGIQVNPGVVGNRATYRAIITGTLDNDPTRDWLCIYYPTHTQFGCDTTLVEPGVPGVFVSFFDDLTN